MQKSIPDTENTGGMSWQTQMDLSQAVKTTHTIYLLLSRCTASPDPAIVAGGKSNHAKASFRIRTDLQFRAVLVQADSKHNAISWS